MNWRPQPFTLVPCVGRPLRRSYVNDLGQCRHGLRVVLLTSNKKLKVSATVRSGRTLTLTLTDAIDVNLSSYRAAHSTYVPQDQLVLAQQLSKTASILSQRLSFSESTHSYRHALVGPPLVGGGCCSGSYVLAVVVP